MVIKVLVVEDEPLVRMLAVDLVEDVGFEAIEACNADEAISILNSEHDIRVLISDINMPGSMDGVQFAAAARERMPSLEIIVVSGKLRLWPEQLPEGSVFLPKPYDIDRLSETLVRMAA